MGPNHVVLDPRQVSCLLLPDKWEALLRALGILKEFKDIPDGLREDFRISAHGPVTSTHTPPHDKSALERPNVILDHIKTNVTAGRYTGPFTRNYLELLIGPFRTAPWGW
jgi:hypothetical protein